LHVVAAHDRNPAVLEHPLQCLILERLDRRQAADLAVGLSRNGKRGPTELVVPWARGPARGSRVDAGVTVLRAACVAQAGEARSRPDVTREEDGVREQRGLLGVQIDAAADRPRAVAGERELDR
jgi:hypothetical protein